MNEIVPSETPKHQDAGFPLREINTPEARSLAEWYLLLGDLQYCIGRVELWHEMTEPSPKDNVGPSVSLFRDAVISLMACFDVAAPVRLDKKIITKNLNGGEEYLRWLLALRDTWIAHRHGPSRQAVVGVMVNETTGEYLGMGHFCSFYQSPKADAANDLIRFIKICIQYTEDTINDLTKKVEEQAKRMPAFTRLRLPTAEFTVPGPDSLRMGRKKYRGITRSMKRRKRKP